MGGTLRYELRDRVVFITGASGGIGRACAVEFARAGCRIVAAARSTAKLHSLADELGPARVLPVTLDVTDADARATAIAAARKRFGRIDVLINNAGWASFGTVARLPAEHLRRMLALNFEAPVALIQAVLPEMVARGEGQIINISSVVGAQAIPRMTVYSATKAALNSLSTGLRMELRGSGVDVIRISPSSTRTEFFNQAATVDAKATRIAEAQYPPERVARAVVAASRSRKRDVTLSVEGGLITAIRRMSTRMADAVIYRVAKGAMPMIDTEPPA